MWGNAQWNRVHFHIKSWSIPISEVKQNETIWTLALHGWKARRLWMRGLNSTWLNHGTKLTRPLLLLFHHTFQESLTSFVLTRTVGIIGYKYEKNNPRPVAVFDNKWISANVHVHFTLIWDDNLLIVRLKILMATIIVVGSNRYHWISFSLCTTWESTERICNEYPSEIVTFIKLESCNLLYKRNYTLAPFFTESV